MSFSQKMRILYDRTGFYFFKAYNAFRFADVVEWDLLGNLIAISITGDVDN